MARKTIIRGGVIADELAIDPTVSTNAFAEVADWDTPMLKTKRVEILVGGNPVAIRIMGSLNGGLTFPYTIQGSASVAAGSAYTITDYYTAISVEIASATNNQHGTATITCSGVSH